VLLAVEVDGPEVGNLQGLAICGKGDFKDSDPDNTVAIKSPKRSRTKVTQ
jgi:hypothetical protein